MPSSCAEHYTEPQRQMINCLALAIAQRLRILIQCEKGIGNRQDCYIHHMYQADFEIACQVLWQIGVTVAAYNAGQSSDGISYVQYNEDSAKRQFPPYFLLKPDQEIERLANVSQPSTWPPIENVIEAYLRVATDYGTDRKFHLPTPRNTPFSVTHSHQGPPMEAFVMNQYATKSGGEFVWTDKIAPVMTRIWLWSEADVEWSSVDEAKILEQTIAIVSHLEDEKTADSEPYFGSLSIAYQGLEIMQKWDGARLSEQRLSQPFLTFDEAMAVSLEMAKEP